MNHPQKKRDEKKGRRDRCQIQNAAQPLPTLSFGIVKDLAAHEITF
jgi:hypothetical protein